MHQRLQARGLAISERAVTHVMQRYPRIGELAGQRSGADQGSPATTKTGDPSARRFAARCGSTPVLWVVRDCLSRSDPARASFTQQYERREVTALLQEVKRLLERLEVPVKGILSDGEETIRSAVAFVFPGMPHQLCQFHSLKDAIAPVYEADRHAKTLLKKQVRGVRPIERALEEHPTTENDAIRDYCLAVRASLTDDGRSPLEASGLRLQERLTQMSDSIARVQEKKDYRHP